MTRMRTGKQAKLSLEEKVALKSEKEDQREKFESQNMGKYILLYPLSDETKEFLKNEKANKQDIDNYQDTISDQAGPSEAVLEKRTSEQTPKKLRKQTPEALNRKAKLLKKKTVKEEAEEDDEGDVYLRYLRKANMIWEDFTTGKKKPKDEPQESQSKKADLNRMKSLNPRTKSTNAQQIKPKPVATKTNSAAVSHSNSIKKK